MIVQPRWGWYKSVRFTPHHVVGYAHLATSWQRNTLFCTKY